MNVRERKLGRGEERLTQGEAAATREGRSQKDRVNRKVRKTKQKELTEGKGGRWKGRKRKGGVASDLSAERQARAKDSRRKGPGAMGGRSRKTPWDNIEAIL